MAGDFDPADFDPNDFDVGSENGSVLMASLVGMVERGASVDAYMGKDLEWLTSAGVLETYDDSHLNDYARAGSESGGLGATGVYIASIGCDPPEAGRYWAFWTVRNGSSPTVADLDIKFNRESLDSDGTNWYVSFLSTTSLLEAVAAVIQMQMTAKVINVAGLPGINGSLGPIVRGATYSVVTGNPILFSRTTGTWTALQDSTPTLRFRRTADATIPLSMTGVYLDDAGQIDDGSASVAVRFELEGTDTDALTDVQNQAYEFDVVALYSTGAVVPLINAGPANVRWG